MKKRIKLLLTSIGLINVAHKIDSKIKLIKKRKRLKKYDHINFWKLDYQNLNLSFNVSNLYSKGWFYPRYDDGNIHEPLATDIFINYIDRKSHILDIGGHLGYFTCIASKLAKNGKVHVFEVDPNCISLIQDNLNVNNLNNVEIHNYAISNSNCTVKIPKLESPNPGMIINLNGSYEYIEVKAIKIDDFLAYNHIKPDFIKIDIEGAEGKALEGMKNTLAHGNATILLELHIDSLRKNFNTDYREIIHLLLTNGYTLREIEHRNSDGNSRTIDSHSILVGNTMILCEKKSGQVENLSKSSNNL